MATLEEIFLAAVEKPPADRAGYLDDACAADARLRAQVEALLRSHVEAGSLFDQPLFEPAPVADRPPVGEHTGTLIGPYKLIEPIGEGGMGTVWMAQQTEPVKRLVAVKLIKAGMDSAQVVARFEAERQALALMDHPNIARVLDGGTTGSGRPYFVMDLVKGVPITRYCDEHHLTPRQRLELFLTVCDAVQHAHHKGIVHRDLKPTNVLVAPYDGKPVVKVIDFGVAKAAGQQLTERTLVTGFGAIVGTLEYMSPEQAELNNRDVDTRSDVYALGVLLYELLSGTTPLERERCQESGFVEALRIIREEDVPTLSNRLAATRELPAIAARRGTEPAKLTKLMRGELDWVLMMALEKDRNRRYQTANGLARDLEHYLRDEPVRACPPSAGYRLRKFVRRNKGAVFGVAASFLLLLAGITGTTWGLVRAEQARRAEAGQRQLAEAALVSERKAKEAEAEQRALATEAAKKAKREAAVAAAINDFLNRDLLQLASPLGQVAGGVSPDAKLTLRTVLQRAAKRIDGKFPNEPEVEMRLRYSIGWALLFVGDNAGALPQLEKVVAAAQDLLGREDPFTLAAEFRLASAHRQLRHLDIAVPLLEKNFERHKTILGPDHAQTLRAMNGLSLAYRAARQTEKALELAEQCLELRKRRLGLSHIDTLVTMNNTALVYLDQGRVIDALQLYEQALDGMKATLDPLHPERLNTTANLARAYHVAEQIDKAVGLQEALVRQFRTVHGLDDTRTQNVIDNLIAYSVDIGWCDKAQALLVSIQTGGANRRTSVNERKQDEREKRHRDLIQRVRPAADKYRQELAAKKEDHADTLAARQAFAAALRGQKRTSAAAYHLKAVLDARQRLLPGDHPETQACRLELGTVRLHQKRYAEAEPLLLEAVVGLQRHEATTPAARSRLLEAHERLVQLYDDWGKKDAADEWRKKLQEQKK